MAQINLYQCLVSMLVVFVFCAQAHCIVVIRDSEVESSVSEIMQPIILKNKLCYKHLKVFIIPSDAINALIYDNDNIYINYGLFRYSEKQPLVLAGILAHEIAHIKEKHLIKNVVDMESTISPQVGITYLLGILSGLSIGPEVGAAVAASASIIDLETKLRNSRENEVVADSYALKYLDNAGYSNAGLRSVLQYLDTIEADVRDQLIYISNHPSSKDRILQISNYKIKNPIRPIPAKVVKNYRRAVLKLRIMMGNDLNFSDLNNNAADYQDDEKLYAEALLYYKAGQMRKAISSINKLIDKEPRNPYLYETRAEMFRSMDKSAQTCSDYNTALKILKNGDTALKLRAALSIISCDPEQSIAWIKSVIADYYDNPTLWRYLAMAAINNQDKNLYYYSLARKAFVEKDLKTFKAYFQRISQIKYSSLRINYYIDPGTMMKILELNRSNSE